MIDEKDKKIKDFLKANQSKIPLPSNTEWEAINRRLTEKKSLPFLSWKVLVPLSSVAALSLMLLISSPQFTQPTTINSEDIKIAEFMWKTYEYVDEMDNEPENDLYWDVGQ